MRVAISTAGLAPRVGKILKKRLQARWTRVSRASSNAWRRQRERDARRSTRRREESRLRRKAMIEAARGFEAEVRFEYPAWFERDDAER